MGAAAAAGPGRRGSRARALPRYRSRRARRQAGRAARWTRAWFRVQSGVGRSGEVVTTGRGPQWRGSSRTRVCGPKLRVCCVLRGQMKLARMLPARTVAMLAVTSRGGCRLARDESLWEVR